MNAIEALIPIFIMLGMFLTIFGVVYIRSRENMALIDRGINPRQDGPKPRYFINLRYGLLLLGVGLGLISAYLIDVVLLGHKMVVQHTAENNVNWSGITDTREPIIYFALVAIGGGLGLFMAYKMEFKHIEKNRALQ